MNWIRRLRPAPRSTARLVFLPHAGGAASSGLPLAEHLHPAVEVLAVQYPGRQDRLAEPPVDDLLVLADHVLRALGPWNDKPLALFGHSLGAVIAYEVALRMERETSAPPVQLFVSGMRAPSRRRHEDVHLRDDAGILAELGGLSGTDPGPIGEEMLRILLPTIRSDYRAFETYAGSSDRLLCPVTAFLGAADPMVTVDEARAWADHSTGTFALRLLRGGHFYLTEPGNTAEIADEVSRRLTGATEPRRSMASAPSPERRTRT